MSQGQRLQKLGLTIKWHSGVTHILVMLEAPGPPVNKYPSYSHESANIA